MSTDTRVRTGGPPRARQRWQLRSVVRPLVAHLLAIVTVLPLLYLVLSAFKPADEIFDTGVPSRLTLDNLRQVLSDVPMERFLTNSAVVALAVTGVALITHSMAAYALARLQFPGRGVIFTLIISTLLVSLPVILVPLFLIAKQLGILNSYLGLIVPAIFNAFGIFLLRQYYQSFPKELEEAAAIDGCSYFRRYWHVILPLSRPALASLSVLFFLANWNAFLWPLTITQNPNLRVVQLGIAGLQGEHSSEYNLILAASLIAAIPTVIVFLVAQRHLVDAMKTAGLK